MTGCISTAPCLVGKARSLLSSPSSPFDPPHATCGAIISKSPTTWSTTWAPGAALRGRRKSTAPQSPVSAGPGSGEGKPLANRRARTPGLDRRRASAGSWQLAALVSRFGSGWQRVFSVSEAAIQALLAMPPLRYRQEQCDVMRSGAPRPLFLSICLSTAPAAFLPVLHT